MAEITPSDGSQQPAESLLAVGIPLIDGNGARLLQPFAGGDPAPAPTRIGGNDLRDFAWDLLKGGFAIDHILTEQARQGLGQIKHSLNPVDAPSNLRYFAAPVLLT